ADSQLLSAGRVAGSAGVRHCRCRVPSVRTEPGGMATFSGARPLRLESAAAAGNRADLTEFSRMRPRLQREPIPYQQQMPEWNPVLRIAFRFSVAYLGLFCAATQLITSLFSATQGSDIPDPGTLWPLRPLVVWTAGHIFHVAAPLSLGGNSVSGDCMFGWVTAFCLLFIAAFATLIWSF